MPKKGNLILIVDDDPDVSRLIGLSLKIEGFETINVPNALQAQLFIEQEKPDLIILDIMMPRISGWEFLKVLKSNPQTASIPVVILSAKAQQTDIKYGKKLGITAYVTKPFSPTELAETVKQILQAPGSQVNSDQ